MRGFGTTARRLTSLSLLLALTFVSGCASLPPARSVSDIASLEGKWTGTGGTIQSGSGPIEFTIRRDGTFDLFVPWMGSGGTKIPGTFKLEGNSIFYETETRIGFATLHEDGPTRTLVIKGKNRKDGGDLGESKVTQVRR